MNTTTQPTQLDIRQTLRINRITLPYEETSVEREPFIVTLTSGREIHLAVPLTAAVELERKGYDIRGI